MINMCNGFVVVFAVLAFTTMISSRPQVSIFPIYRPWEVSRRAVQFRRSLPENYRPSSPRMLDEASLARRNSQDDSDTQTARHERVRPSNETTARKRSENGNFKILTGRLSARGSETSDIYFPGPKAGDILTAPTKPPCGEGRTFCEDTDQYPTNYIEGILQNSGGEYTDLLGVDELQDVEIGQRIDFVSEFELCRSTEQLVFPKSAQNKDDDWLFVVNQANYMQGVRVELCQGENSPCEFSENFPNGYNSMCQQKYIFRKMLALGKNGSTVTDIFKLPSCCSCVVSNPLGIGSRSGSFGPENPQTPAKKPANPKS